MSDQAAAQIRCDEHHWVSHHQPDFPVYWIRRCSLCGYYDPDDMAEQIAKHVTYPEQAEARATLAKVAAIVADPDAALVVDRIREVLEPTPKGKP